MIHHWRWKMDWIKCSERMPEEVGNYLVACYAYPDFYNLVHEVLWCDPRLQKNKWRELGYSRIVTHWIPLPEQPKETNNETTN
jgi:hypothetical protein